MCMKKTTITHPTSAMLKALHESPHHGGVVLQQYHGTTDAIKFDIVNDSYRGLYSLPVKQKRVPVCGFRLKSIIHFS